MLTTTSVSQFASRRRCMACDAVRHAAQADRGPSSTNRC
jgi:hypothetical protein